MNGSFFRLIEILFALEPSFSSNSFFYLVVALLQTSSGFSRDLENSKSFSLN